MQVILTPNNLRSGDTNKGVIQLSNTLYGEFQLVSFITSYIPYVIFSGVNDQIPVQGVGTVTLTEGWYDGNSLATELSTELSTLLNPIVVTVTFDNNTQKLTFTTSDASSLIFTFLTTTRPMNRVLGLNRSTITVTSGGSSTRVCDFRSLDAIYLEMQQKKWEGQTYNLVPLLKTLVIPWKSEDGNKIICELKQKFNFQGVRELQFQFTDENNNLVSFLGGWTLLMKKI